MKKKVVLFALVLSLTILNACASEQAAYVNGTGSGKAAVPDTSALPVQAAEATGMAHADETAEKTGSSDAVPSDMKAVLLDKVINTDASYSAYDADIFGADYIGDGKTEYFIVFTEKGSKKEAAIGCSADIWFGDESGVKRVAEWQCIEPDTYGSLTLAGKYYFRYDLAFVTESQTILLSVKDGKNVESYNCLGFAEFKDKNNDFTVTSSTYDMIYSKNDDLTCGHTWKKYYFYADAAGFHEYGAVKITKNEFLKYSGADTIIREINSEYGKEGTSVTCEFLKRCNGLIHININCETKDDITHYYRTCKITGDNTLETDETAEGSYMTAISDKAVYK